VVIQGESSAAVRFRISLIGETHIGGLAPTAVLVVWFGYIAHLSQWGGGAYFLYCDYHHQKV
jgi:hypothetical protein